MLNFAHHALLGRKLRVDDLEDLGRPTQDIIIDAIDAGCLDEARELAKYTVAEGKSLHDLFCDGLWDILTKVSAISGEESVYQLLRSSQETWMLRRTWKAFRKIPVVEQVAITAEIMRSHHCGPNQDGAVLVIEEQDRYIIPMDHCGSGAWIRPTEHRHGSRQRTILALPNKPTIGHGDRSAFRITAYIAPSMKSYQWSGTATRCG